MSSRPQGEIFALPKDEVKIYMNRAMQFKNPVGANFVRPCHCYNRYTGEQSSPLRVRIHLINTGDHRSPLRVRIQTSIIYIARLYKHSNRGERPRSPLRKMIAFIGRSVNALTNSHSTHNSTPPTLQIPKTLIHHLIHCSLFLIQYSMHQKHKPLHNLRYDYQQNYCHQHHCIV